MKKIILPLIAIGLLVLTGCPAREVPVAPGVPVSLQLQWITQAQFAGYYVALDKGWYRQEGIDLTIKPGGTDIVPIDRVAGGESDFGTVFLADLISAIETGKPVISIAQIQQMNGLLLISRKSSGIRRPGDFIGKRVGVWGSSFETQLNALLFQQKINREEVRIMPQGFDMEPFLNGELDVASAMIYNEYHQVLEKGVKIQDLNVIDYTLYGLGFPGDVLFANRLIVKNSPAVCTGMVRASLRGWQYAIENPAEAVDIVLKYDKSGRLEKAHQVSMMREIALLVKVPWAETGYTDQATIQSVVKTLLRYRILEEKLQPEVIFTNQFWEQARVK